jgi:ribosome maturation factor RimP
MLDKNKIEEAVNEYLRETDKYLVHLEVKKGNVINVFIDGDNGVDIDDCVNVSRMIESRFDRDIEDYELRVSSPGTDVPFKLNRQYKRYIHRQISVTLKDKSMVTGTLKSVNEHSITLEVKKGKKKLEKELMEIFFDDIFQGKPVITFEK